MPAVVEELSAEAQRVYEAALWASESQYGNCKVWRIADTAISVSAAVAAGVAGVAGLADLITAQWAGGIAIASAALGAVNASLGAGRIASASTVAANQYRNLQQDVRVFCNIELPSMSEEDAAARLRQLINRQQELNESSPVPSSLAVRTARTNINRGGQRYEVDGQ